MENNTVILDRRAYDILVEHSGLWQQIRTNPKHYIVLSRNTERGHWTSIAVSNEVINDKANIQLKSDIVDLKTELKEVYTELKARRWWKFK